MEARALMGSDMKVLWRREPSTSSSLLSPLTQARGAHPGTCAAARPDLQRLDVKYAGRQMQQAMQVALEIYR